jgi:cell wall-associated NlpC family hydrolase
VLSGVRDALAGVAAQAGATWQQAGQSWWGAGARSAHDFSTATAAAVTDLAERTDRLGVGAAAAGDAVTRAGARLRGIVERFEGRVAALEPHLDTPGVAEELLAEAQHALQEAVTVVEELRAELDTHAAAAAQTPAASTVPAGFGGAALPGLGGGGLPAAGAGSGVAKTAAYASPVDGRPRTAGPRPDAAVFGDGVAVTLPDGTTATAPNAVAAGAVRHALTQLGVPYQWGGTTPGVGLDCSGLTQWAYREAGLDIPRLAQEQDVGAAVDPGALAPGDLAVWDGHVAMIVGNGVMVEAGDPVQLSPVRTTNAGQGFHGFFRPTG